MNLVTFAENGETTASAKGDEMANLWTRRASVLAIFGSAFLGVIGKYWLLVVFAFGLATGKAIGGLGWAPAGPSANSL